MLRRSRSTTKAFIADLITPIIGLLVGQPNFESLSFSSNSSQFRYGDYLNEPGTKECPECTLAIPVAALRVRRRAPRRPRRRSRGHAGRG